MFAFVLQLASSFACSCFVLFKAGRESFNWTSKDVLVVVKYGFVLCKWDKSQISNFLLLNFLIFVSADMQPSMQMKLLTAIKVQNQQIFTLMTPTLPSGL